jgi:rubredoxin
MNSAPANLACPKCSTAKIRRSRITLADKFYQLLGYVAFRCSLCRHRWRQRLPPGCVPKPATRRIETIRRRKTALLRKGLVYAAMLAFFALFVLLISRERG